MICPYCQNDKSKVVEVGGKHSDIAGAHVKRRRECLNKNCQKRFNTFECYEMADTESIFAAREALDCIEKGVELLKSIH
jgi:transcriptional regulator NrdR family protein